MRMRKTITALAAVAVIVVSLLLFVACDNAKGVYEEYTIEGKDSLTVGILSDAQLTDDIDDKYSKAVISALTTLKARDVDSIIYAGDVGDTMTTGVQKNWKAIYSKVFPDGSKQPIKNFIMGNHDYWLPNFFECWDIPDNNKLRNRFTKATGESPWSHKVINGYHFINVSPTNGDMGESAYNEDMLAWADSAIQKAVKESPTKPIIVTTHHNPKTDIYGGADWGLKNLNDLLSKYPQVVSISGHIHYSMIDERSITQSNGYTAFSTQSMSYTDFESDVYELAQETGDTALNEQNPMAMIMTIKGNNINVERINAYSGEKMAADWNFDAPFTPDNKVYDNAKRASSVGDVTLSGEGTYSLTSDTLKVDFPAANAVNGQIVEYAISLYDANGYLIKPSVTDLEGYSRSELILKSDYYAVTAENMRKQIKFEFKLNNINIASVRVEAVEAWGKRSAPLILTKA